MSVIKKTITDFLRRLAVLLGILFAVVLAFAGTVWMATPAQRMEPHLAAVIDEQIRMVDGRERRHLAVIPKYRSDQPSLVLVLHGSGMSAEFTRALYHYRFDELAVRDGAIILYPEGWHSEWNGCRAAPQNEAHLENIDDVSFLIGLIDQYQSQYDVEPEQIFVVGMSNGGQMAYRLATERPDVLRAVAVLVAQQPMRHNSQCLNAQAPVSMLVMNGTQDPIVPFGGGIPSLYGYAPAGEVQSWEGTLEHWKAVNRLSGDPATTNMRGDPATGSWIERQEWGSANEAQLIGIAVHGGGHTVPGGWQYAPEFIVGSTNKDIIAADEIWRFFHHES